MSRGTAPYRCDAEGCDKQRGNESNHWLLVWTEYGAIGTAVSGASILKFSRWHEQAAELPNMLHVCGQNHASLLLARWMSNRTLDVVQVSDPPQIAVRG